MTETNEDICPICIETMISKETLSLPCHPNKSHKYHLSCIMETIRHMQQETPLLINTLICPECRKQYSYKYGEVNGYNVSFVKVFELHKYWSLYGAILMFLIPISLVSYGYVFYRVIKENIDSIIVLNVIFSILINIVYMILFWQCIKVRQYVIRKNYNLLSEYESIGHMKNMMAMTLLFCPPLVLLGFYVLFPTMYTVSGCIFATIILWMRLPHFKEQSVKGLDTFLNKIMKKRSQQIDNDLKPVINFTLTAPNSSLV